jgi:hypothetical protein
VHRLGESGDEPTPDEQWLGMTPAEQAADFEALTRRRWPLVVVTVPRSLPEFDGAARILAPGH